MKLIDHHIKSNISIAPLVTFRILFGLIMLISIVRFALNGWIYEQYIKPDFFFSYYGFEWIQPLSSTGIYVVFFLIGLSAFMIMIGAYYRIFACLFFVCFTYTELIDKTNYLNHYYFVSLIGFLLIFVPANRYFSIDTWLNPRKTLKKVPAWTINIFKLQLGMVYFYAGFAKLNADWLFRAMPLKIWLPANSHIPIVGSLLKSTWVAYFFSWFGAIYDLSIPFVLLKKKFRLIGYAFVIIFHIATWLLFPIGMFPFIMILSTLIFFSASWHEHFIDQLQKLVYRLFKIDKSGISNNVSYDKKPIVHPILKYVLIVHLLIQIVMPMRYILYPGDLFWTEEGYRFSWRVMLMEKAGYVIFEIEDPATGNKGQAFAHEYLTPNQEKMMATQPDMILQFAHFLAEEYEKQGLDNPVIKANAYVTLNGNRSRQFIDPDVNLIEIKEGFAHKDWVLPFNN